jgi:hypothetical protein
MATPPTFSVGQYNTAAYMNSIGLWKISTTTIGTGVSSVNISNVFTSDYDRYKIIVQGVDFSASAANAYLQLFFNGTNYYSAVNYQQAASYTLGTTGIAAGFVWMVGITGDIFSQYEIDLTSPLGTSWKLGQSTFTAGDSVASYGGSTRLWNTNSTTSTGFSFYPSTGTMTGGTITIYGVRK